MRREGDQVRVQPGHFYALCGIVLVALILRLWGLSSQSLWFDELFSLKHVRLSLGPMLTSLAEDGTNLPVYHLFLKVWVALFGDSEFSLRLPSVLFGTLTVPLLYHVGASIFNKEAGLISAILISISSFHIYYAQEARMYTLLALLMLLSSTFLFEWLKKRTVRSAVYYVFLSGILLYTHYYGIFLILAQNIYVLGLILIEREGRRSRLGPWIVMQGGIAAFFLPWVIFWFMRIGNLNNASWFQEPSLHDVYMTFAQFVNGPVSLLLCAALLGLAIALPLWNRRSSVHSDYRASLSFTAHSRQYYLVVWVLSLMVVPLLVSIVYRRMYHPRDVIGATFPFSLLIGGALTAVARMRFLRYLIVALLIALAIPNILRLYQPGIKPQWREVTHAVEARAAPGDLVLIVGQHHKLIFEYYAQRTDLVVSGRNRIVRNFDVLNVDGKRRQRVAQDFMGLTQGYNRVWLIAHEKEDGDGVIQSVLSEAFHLDEDISYARLRLSLFTR